MQLSYGDKILFYPKVKNGTWYSKNRLKVLAVSKLRYSANKRAISKRRKLKYLTNSAFRTHVLEKQAAYRSANAVNIRTKLRSISTQPYARFNSVKRAAKRKDRSFTLTFKAFSTLISKKCTYCGANELCKTGSGLDRKDNRFGYTEVNVVPCCSACNSVKNINFTYSEMLIIGKTISKIHQLRHERRANKRL